MASQTLIPPGFLDRAATLAELGREAKTLQTWVREGKIRSQLVPVPGRKPERVYEAEHVRELAERFPPPPKRNGPDNSETSQPGDNFPPWESGVDTQPTNSGLTISKAPRPARGGLGFQWPAELIEFIRLLTAERQKQLEAPAVQEPLFPPVPLSEKLWLTYEEAGAYSGLPVNVLRRIVREGRVHAVRGRVQRSSLEEYEG